MRLINYGPGEISDRLSILALKIVVSTEKGRDATHFRTEQTALLTQIRARTLNGKWFEAYTALAAVNALLWHAEDELRLHRAQGRRYLGGLPPAMPEDVQVATWTQAIVVLAFRIQALNDERAALVQKINEDAGEAGGAEKL